MDHSSMSTLLSCPKKYELSYKLRKAEDKGSSALDFGTAWHAICEEHGRRNIPVASDTLVDEVLDQLQWQDRPDDYRTAEKLRLAYPRWVEQHGRHYVWKAVEKGFYNELGYSEPHEGRYDGRIETDVNQFKGQELWLLDLKTTGRLESDWVEHYSISSQFTGYYSYGKAQWPELAGVLVDVFHATKGNKSGKTEDEKLGIRFLQLPIRFTDAKVEEFKQEYGDALALRDLYESRGRYPRNTSACRMYNRTCGFIDICQTDDPDLRQQMIEALSPNTFSPHGE